MLSLDIWVVFLTGSCCAIVTAKTGSGYVKVTHIGRHPPCWEWQLSQVLPLDIWVAFLPAAVVPLWQLEQVPLTDVWSILAGNQPFDVWQLSQVFVTWYMGSILTGSCCAIVTAKTGSWYIKVTHISRQPTCWGMAVITSITTWDMGSILTGSSGAIMTARASTAYRCVIHISRQPAIWCMAVVTGVCHLIYG